MKTAFHVVYTVLALNFIIPVLFYVFDGAGTIENWAWLGEFLGGDPYGHTEDSVLWRVLGIANVATLGFCCVLLQLDLKKWFPVLTPLVFLKGSASFGFLVAFLLEGYPQFLAAFLFDGVTVAAMLFFAIRAHRVLDGDTVPQPAT
ncbi:MAG: hypothetical protein JRJ84_25255 [Deltaproteobacteria bacterium]|nr:hypothetical protein [Deltaproteobacteria bacterium]